MGLKLALRDPNLALSFHSGKHILVQFAWRYSNLYMNQNQKDYNEANIRTQPKQPVETLGDPWSVKEHNWNTSANEKHQLNPSGSTVAVLGDCWSIPLYINAAKRCVNYLLKILKMQATSL